jgi:hypothetical protein
VAVEEFAEGGAASVVEQADRHLETAFEERPGGDATPLGGEVGDEVDLAGAEVD